VRQLGNKILCYETASPVCLAALDRNRPLRQLLPSVAILQINLFVNPLYALLVQTDETFPEIMRDNTKH
jgi:hypothetical protein